MCAFLTPAGTYNPEIRTTKTAPCTACPEGRTTSQAGATTINDCSLCVVGYGGSDCNQRCGGGRGANATYGVEGSEARVCEPCPAVANGFTFYYRGNQSAFVPAVVSRLGAGSAGDCLAEFAQITDSAWALGGTVQLTDVANIASFEACAEACRTTSNCQYATYDYEASLAADNRTYVPKCSIKRPSASAQA